MKKLILILLDLNKDVDNYMDIVKSVVTSIVQTIGEVDKESADVIREHSQAFSNILEKHRELIIDKFVALYSEMYEESEIKDMIEFFNTHSGEKYATRFSTFKKDMDEFNKFIIKNISNEMDKLLEDQHIVVEATSK